MAESRTSGKAGVKSRSPRKAAPKPKPASKSKPAPEVARKARVRKSAVPATAAKPRARSRPAAPAKAASTSRRVAAPKAKAKAKTAQPGGKIGRRAGAAGRKVALPQERKPAPALSEEDQIRSAKFLPRDLPARLFEEERFLFPESYGVNRIRLLVKDPEWLFAHWDVDPKSLGVMKQAMGERAMALSRLTLRVVDPTNGGSSDILLPPLARGWYIRADATRRSYKALLGVTLPSGEFRQLAESNVVVPPRVGPSRERAQKRITFSQAGRIPQDAPFAQRDEELRSLDSAAGPWRAPSVDATQPEKTASGAPAPAVAASSPLSPTRGGASDVYGPGGASDVHRR